MDKIIFHIDVNSAYLSWSALRLLADGAATDLRDIPSIIGGDMEMALFLPNPFLPKNTALSQASQLSTPCASAPPWS